MQIRIEDDPRFKEHLMRPTALEVLLRGHLWMESELIAIIEEVLPYPKQIDLARLGFPLKVTLAAAHGLMWPEDVNAYLKLNTMRNRIAHNLHDDPTERSVDELIASFGKKLITLYPGEDDIEGFINSGENLWLGRLRAAIACMCISLNGEREKLSEHKRQLRETDTRYKNLIQRLKTDK